MAPVSVSVPTALRPRPTYVHDGIFDLESVPELPDSHLWPEFIDKESAGGCPSCDKSLPVIDLDDPDAANCMGRACETWGMFQLTGHGIPPGLIDRLESQAHQLFSLPADHKLKAARRPGSFNGYGQVPISTLFEKSMWSEGFTITDSPVDWACRLWPNNYVEFCAVTEEYKEKMKLLGLKILWLILDFLGITEEDMSWGGPNGDPNKIWTTLHFNWYPPCPDPSRAMGMVTHTDSLMLTLLYPGRTGGLQVLGEHGAQAHWVTIDPAPGSFIVNVGDFLHIITNGRFHAPLHRAIVNKTGHRFSAPLFIGPPINVLIQPLLKLVNEDKAQLYRAVTWDEYHGLKQKYFQDAYEVIRLRSSLDEDSDLGDENNVLVQPANFTTVNKD